MIDYFWPTNGFDSFVYSLHFQIFFAKVRKMKKIMMKNMNYFEAILDRALERLFEKLDIRCKQKPHHGCFTISKLDPLLNTTWYPQACLR